VWNQDIYQKAIKFAGEAHSGQTVPGTESSYIVHLANVCNEVLVAFSQQQSFDVNLAVQCALLHDVLEDTETSEKKFQLEFGNDVLCCVKSLSKNHNLTKEAQLPDSIRRILSCRKEAGITKLADRITNLQKPPGFWTKEKKNSYLQEAEFICSQLSHLHSYLAGRIAVKIEEYREYCR